MRTMRRDYGFSLVELMIASAIGLLLLSGLTMIFVNSSEASREQRKTSQQIENGRYAIDLLSQDLRLAGFYGHIYDMVSITASASPTDPCLKASGDRAEMLKGLRYPVHGYAGTIDGTTPTSDADPNVATTTCAALTAANLKNGSDVLVIRRADTNALAVGDIAATDVFYIQSSAIQAEIQLGAGAAIAAGKKADGTTAAVLYLTNGAATPPAAPIRRYHVRVYFVAPCSVPTGGGTICTGATDDGGNPIPTLKRLELTSTGTITVVPLVEGIDYLKVEYGIDDAPSTINLATQLAGDASVDRFDPTPAAADWPNVIAAKIYVLARNTEATRGYTDNKTYKLGSVDVPARNDNFKRHVYSAAVHMPNPAGRREVP